MSRLTQHLVNYAAYHRDKRNVVTHMIGIPMIVLAIVILLSRPVWDAAGVAVTPALIIAVGAAVFYFTLEIWLGVVMSVLFGLCLWAGAATQLLSTISWLGLGAGLFLIGWVVQFVGHAYEGRKPAFFDEIVSLMIGPAFVVAEVGFMLGLLDNTRAAVADSLAPDHFAQTQSK